MLLHIYSGSSTLYIASCSNAVFHYLRVLCPNSLSILLQPPPSSQWSISVCTSPTFTLKPILFTRLHRCWPKSHRGQPVVNKPRSTHWSVFQHVWDTLQAQSSSTSSKSCQKTPVQSPQMFYTPPLSPYPRPLLHSYSVSTTFAP